MCALHVYVYSHAILQAYLYIDDMCFIDELQIDKSHCLTCKIHSRALEYSIIRHYTNVYYYYILFIWNLRNQMHDLFSRSHCSLSIISFLPTENIALLLLTNIRGELLQRCFQY